MLLDKFNDPEWLANYERIFGEPFHSPEPVVRESEPEPEPDNANVARSMADLVTPRQLAAIRVIANGKGLNPAEECQALMGCTPERLTIRAASRFMAHLKTL